MKANELMIGDFVTFKDCQNDEVKPAVKIWQLNKDNEAFAFIDSEDALEEIEIDDEIIGIPLTSEILEKNGFKEKQLPIGIRKMIWESEDTRTEIVLYMDDTMPMEIRKNIYYEDEICYTLPFVWAVHQLQHALRLCGIDKEITL